MSLYNMILGIQPAAKGILSVLGVDPRKCGRLRDAFPAFHKEKLVFAILTRNGGGNREEFKEVFEYFSTLKYYLEEFDDPEDCTYAYFLFDIPPSFEEEDLILLREFVIELNVVNRMNTALKNLEIPKE